MGRIQGGEVGGKVLDGSGQAGQGKGMLGEEESPCPPAAGSQAVSRVGQVGWSVSRLWLLPHEDQLSG